MNLSYYSVQLQKVNGNMQDNRINLVLGKLQGMSVDIATPPNSPNSFPPDVLMLQCNY